MGCLFSIHKKEEYPTESLYIPLLQQKDPPLYRIDSKSTDESLRDTNELIKGSLSFHGDSITPPPVFESCMEEPNTINMNILQERLERLETNTQQNLKLISEDVHLIYQTMIEKERSSISETNENKINETNENMESIESGSEDL